MRPKTARRILLVLPAICMVVLGTASAATQYWDGNYSTPPANSISNNDSADPLNWLSGGNWDNGTTSAPLASWTLGDAAIFEGNFVGTQTVTLSGQAILGGNTVIGGVGSSYKISLTGGFNRLGAPPSGTITLNAGSTLSADGSSNNAHNLAALTLNGGTLTSANGPAGPANDVGNNGNWIVRGITVGGSSLSTISSTTLAINLGSFNVADAVAGPGTDLLVSSKIISGALTKDGAGTMELTGANTYTGATTVSMGTLALVGGSQTSAVTVSGGASLGFTLGSPTISTSSFNLTAGTVKITGTPTLPSYTLITSSSGITGTPTLDAPLTGYTLIVDGTSLKLVRIKYWDGNVSSANNSSDNSSADPLNWLSGGNWDNGTTSAPLASWTTRDTAIFGGNFSGTQTVTLGSQATVGDGTIIGGAGSSYKISLTGTGFNQLGAPSGTITLNAGSTLSADATSNNAHNLGAITLNGGTLTSANGPAGPANDVGNNGNWIVYGVTVGGSSLSTISSTTLAINLGSFNVADAVAGSGTDLLVSSNIIAGTLTKDGAGTMELTGTNTYTGNTAVNAGTLVLADNAQLKFVLGATSGSNNSISGAGTVSLEGDFVIDTTAADALASGTWTLENVPSLAGPYGANFTVVSGFIDAGSNKWTKPNGAKNYTFDETTGILTLAPAGGYSSWAALNGAGPNLNDDHDNDGVDNGTEYFLGGPNGPTTGFTALPGVVNNLGTLSVTWIKGAGYNGVYNTDFVVETSTTLSDPWTVEASPGNVADSPASVIYTFPGGPAYSGKRFARLRVTGP